MYSHPFRSVDLLYDANLGKLTIVMVRFTNLLIVSHNTVSCSSHKNSVVFRR